MTPIQREVFSLLYSHGPKYVRQIARGLSRAEGAAACLTLWQAVYEA